MHVLLLTATGRVRLPVCAMRNPKQRNIERQMGKQRLLPVATCREPSIDILVLFSI